LAQSPGVNPPTRLGFSLEWENRAEGGNDGRDDDRSLAIDFETSLAWEGLAQGLMIESEDHREGLAAFFEKRAPRFTGR